VNVQFKASFAKDLRNIKNRDALNRIREAVEELEKAQSLQNITNIKKLRGGANYYRLRVGEHRIGLIVEGDKAICVRCLDRKEIYRYFP
jgi:mRNA interferase RelE/StbE